MKNMNLIINTHWDREYRWSFRETQYRLIEAVDELIDIMQRDKGFAYFHTDSQVSMLDDYLEMRPEKRAAVEELVRSGRILTGPWYTLPAEFLVNGEALIRNLLLGHKISGQLGKTMKVAHNIFSWGQVSQLPQIYRLLGMDTITFYRGINQTELDTLEFRWRGADGRESLALTFGAYHRLNFWRYVYKPYILGGSRMVGNSLKIAMARDDLGEAYLTQMCGENLIEKNHWLNNQQPVRDFDSARTGLEQLIDTVIHKSSTDELLFFQGFDQENPDPIITELVNRLNASLEDGEIKIASLEDYVKKLHAKLSPATYEKLPVKEGEMLEVEKCGDAFGPLYNGVFSARMPVKLANARAEYSLINGAEPVAGWVSLLGGEYPAQMLERAWKQLLQNQQHDGIGGCHVDRVSLTMMERYREVEDIAETIIKKSLKQITGQINFEKLAEKEIGLAVYNTLPFRRTDLVSCVVDIPLSWNLRYSGRGRRGISIQALDMQGKRLPAQLLSVEEDTVYSYLKYGDTFDFDASRSHILIQPGEVPQNGYVTLRLLAREGEDRPVELISPRTNELENEYLRVKIHGNGTLSVKDKRTGVEMKNVHYFEDCAEKGGPLIHDAPYEQLMFHSLGEKASVALVYNGPLQAAYRITLHWRLPKRVETELKIHVPHGSEWVDQGKLRRSQEMEEITLVTDVTLRKGAGELHFHTTVQNTVRDHRLRVLFETGRSKAAYCRADSPFDVVRRTVKVPDSSEWYEAAARTWPSHSFVEVADEGGSTAVFHKGICEYEVMDDDQRTIGLTLLRCFGNAGNPTEVYEYQELAECQGEWTFDYWYAVNRADIRDSELARKALQLITPCYVMQTTGHKGSLPEQNCFFAVENEAFLLSAVTCGEKENSLLLRGCYLGEEEGQVLLKMGRDICRAAKVDLENHVMMELQIAANREVRFSAGKREIVTILIEWGSKDGV